MRRAALLALVVGLGGCFSEETLLAQCVDAGRCPFVAATPGDGGAGNDAGVDAGDVHPGPVQSPFDVVVDVSLVPVPVAGQAESYRSAVLTRTGSLVGIPCNRSVDGGARLLVMEPDGGFRTIGLVTGVTRHSWYAGVLGADGFVYAIPYDDEYFLRIDPQTGASTRVGPAIAGSERYRGGVTLRDGRIFAVPYGLSEAAVFDPRDGGLRFLASGQASPMLGTGGTLLADGTVVFATDESVTSSRIWTFDGVALAAAGTTSSVGRAVTLADGGALFFPRYSDQLVAWPGLAATPIATLRDLPGQERLVAGAMSSGRHTVFAIGRSGLLAIGTPLGAAARDGGAWAFGQYEHLTALPDGRLVAFPNDPNPAALVLTPRLREPVPVEVMSAPEYNHY